MRSTPVSFAQWATLILVPYAVILMAALPLGRRPIFTELDFSDLFFFADISMPPFLYYVIFVQAVSHVLRRDALHRLRAGLLSSAVSLTAVILAQIVALTIFVLPPLRLALFPHENPLLDFPWVAVVPLAVGGVIFGTTMGLGFRLWEKGLGRGPFFQANVFGGTIGAMFPLAVLDGDYLTMPDAPIWPWLLLAVVGAIPHVYLTWRAFRRILPVVAPAAG